MSAVPQTNQTTNHNHTSIAGQIFSGVKTTLKVAVLCTPIIGVFGQLFELCRISYRQDKNPEQNVKISLLKDLKLCLKCLNITNVLTCALLITGLAVSLILGGPLALALSLGITAIAFIAATLVIGLINYTTIQNLDTTIANMQQA